MDPSDLNRAVMREHFPMQTVEDVISRMPNAKVFSVLDAYHGFWQVKLAKDSSKLQSWTKLVETYDFHAFLTNVSTCKRVQNILSPSPPTQCCFLRFAVQQALF